MDDGAQAGAHIAGSDGLAPAKTTPAAKADLEDGGMDSGKSVAGTDESAASPPISVPGMEITGISSAQQQMPMQKAEKTNEISASAEQKLPGPAAGVTGEELPDKSLRSVPPASREEKTDLASDIGSSSSGAAAPSGTGSTAAATAAWPSSTPLRSLERAHDLMSLHAFRLRDSGVDSLQVVIKPGPGMQLSLNLQMRDGNVEMSATLHHGDFDFLKSHWAELQQQLEARGVRLAPLTSGDQAGAGDNNSFTRSGHSKEDGNGSQPGALAGFTLSNTLKPATSTKTKTLRGWESWA